MLPLIIASLLAKKNQQGNSAGSGKMAKSIGIALGVGVVGFVGWRVYKNYKEKKEERERAEAVENFGKMVNKKNLHFSEAEFKLMADNLQTAMRGAGTDEMTTLDIISHPDMGRDDFIYLNSVFGIREYGRKKLSLMEWIREEMTESERYVIDSIAAKYKLNF